MRTILLVLFIISPISAAPVPKPERKEEPKKEPLVKVLEVDQLEKEMENRARAAAWAKMMANEAALRAMMEARRNNK